MGKVAQQVALSPGRPGEGLERMVEASHRRDTAQAPDNQACQPEGIGTVHTDQVGTKPLRFGQ